MMKIISPSAQAKKTRDDRICKYFKKLTSRYSSRTALYNLIAEYAGCSNVTVIRVLQDNNLITKKEKKQ